MIFAKKIFSVGSNPTVPTIKTELLWGCSPIGRGKVFIENQDSSSNYYCKSHKNRTTIFQTVEAQYLLDNGSNPLSRTELSSFFRLYMRESSNGRAQRHNN